MTPTETAAILRKFARDCRADEYLWGTSQPGVSAEVGAAIESAIEMIDRLETAERSDAESVAMYRKARDERDALRAAVRHEADCMEAAMAEIKSLRAKIAEMERKELVGVLHVGSCYGEELEDWEFEADQRVCDRLNERHVTNPTSLKLYAFPGAKGE